MRWKPWALVGALALAAWFYAAPIQVTKRIRADAEAPEASGLIAARVDFVRVNAQLPDDLRRAAGGRLTRESFSRLLRQGWLARPAKAGPAAPVLPTKLFHIRYKALNRFIAIYWDESQVHEVVLTLERPSPFHRWRVTRVSQFNVCAYDFDYDLVSPGQSAAKIGGGHS